MPARRVGLAVVLALGTLSGCSSSPNESEPLPPGEPLVNTTADRLRELESVNFSLEVDGAIPGLPVREVEGVAQRGNGPYGYAQGTADVQDNTDRVQYEFLLSEDTLHLSSDDQQEEQAVPEQFSPAHLLGPDQGLHQILEKATDLETEGREELDGAATYRIDGELAQDIAAEVVPAVPGDVDVKFWVRETAEPDLLRIWMQMPPQQQNEGAVTLELALSRHNVPPEPMGEPSSRAGSSTKRDTDRSRG